MRAIEFLPKNKITLQNLYGGNFPDRDETFWDYVRTGELNNPLDIKTLPKYKLAIMLQGQYRVEHLDEILDMMDEDQKEILQRYIDDPNLSKKTIVISGDRIIDGNHRALAAAMRSVPINYVDLADLDEQGVAEGLDSIPTTLYHATYRPLLKSIKKYGLGGDRAQAKWEDSKPGVVYLAIDPNVAESYAETSDVVPEEWLDEIVILKISTVGLDKKKFDIDSNVQDNTGDTIQYTGIIPVSNISLVRQGVAEDFTDDLDNIYAMHPQPEKSEQVVFLITGMTEDEFSNRWTNLPDPYQQEFGHDLPLWDADDLSSYPNLAVKRITFDQYVQLVGNYIKSEELAGSAMSKMKRGVAEDTVDEMALSTYKTMGDFSKPGPFRGADKKLVPHPTNQLKAQKFFEQTPYDFRLFFSNIPGTGKFSEHGSMGPNEIRNSFSKEVADQLITGSEDSITVLFVGNKGDSKVMMTPWIMAHRIGHAIQAGERSTAGTWRAAEEHFFRGINELLKEFYGVEKYNLFKTKPNWQLSQQYNALFNAIGTQRSSRTNKITRPYEFLYEIFAQYLGTGNITLNPLPKQKDYGRKAWGRSTQSLRMKPGQEEETKYTTEVLARDMELMFDDVLSSLVGKIFVM